MESIIHKVVISKEAIFDYSDFTQAPAMPKAAMKDEAEEYITNFTSQGLLRDNYFKANFYDDTSDKMLKLFFHKSYKIGIMQLWVVVGICTIDDWDAELEEFGIIRAWLSSTIDIKDLPMADWVVRLRAVEIVNHPQCYSINGLKQEVKNAFEYGNDKELVEELCFLQITSRKRNGGKRNKRKTALAGKLHKRT